MATVVGDDGSFALTEARLLCCDGAITALIQMRFARPFGGTIRCLTPHHTGGSGSGVLEPPQCAQYNKVTRSYTGEFTKQQQGRATPTTHLTLGA